MNYLKGLAGHDDSQNSSSSLLYGTHPDHRAKDPKKTRGTGRMKKELENLAGYIEMGLRTPAEGKIAVGSDIFFEHCQHNEDEAFRSQVLGIPRASWLASMSKLEGGVTKDSGKSGSLFWKTQDGHYFLKSTPKVEAQKMLDVLPKYREYVKAAIAAKRLCLLPKALGIYMIYAGGEELYLQSFSNVFDTPTAPDRVYDLKGTTEERYVEEAPGKVMKDLNYRDTTISMSEKDREALLEACTADSEFLRSNNIMDYSLLLGVYDVSKGKHITTDLGALSFEGAEITEEDEDDYSTAPAVFRMGIIDIACDYNGKKIAAHWLKKPTLGLCCQQEIDTEPPDYYSERFIDFVSDKVVA